MADAVTSEHYITIKELMALASLGKQTIYALMQDGLPARKFGGALRFPMPAAMAWLDAQPAATPAFDYRGRKHTPKTPGKSMGRGRPRTYPRPDEAPAPAPE